MFYTAILYGKASAIQCFSRTLSCYIYIHIYQTTKIIINNVVEPAIFQNIHHTTSYMYEYILYIWRVYSVYLCLPLSTLSTQYSTSNNSLCWSIFQMVMLFIYISICTIPHICMYIYTENTQVSDKWENCKERSDKTVVCMGKKIGKIRQSAWSYTGKKNTISVTRDYTHIYIQDIRISHMNCTYQSHTRKKPKNSSRSIPFQYRILCH